MNNSDVDSDIAVDIRGKVIDYVKHKYGEKAVCSIMTLGTQGAKAAIRNCARLLGDKLYGDSKRLYALGSEMCSYIPKDPGAKLSDSADSIRTVFANRPDALEVLRMAELVENTATTLGTHAAGIIISDNGDVSDYIPLMVSKDGLLQTQCDMTYCEGLGLLKMDFLGLRNLGLISETLKRIYADRGIKLELSDIPMDDKKVYSEIFAKGNTDSVFQFESDGMKNLLRRFKPDNIEHLILLNAIFRPGPLQYIDDVCAVKNEGKKAVYVIPEMESILGLTYGKPIYQEQLMQIFHQFADFSLSESDTLRRYISKKKVDKFMSYKDKFVNGLAAHGAKKEAAEKFWNELIDFASYAFNKSHSCAYSYVAYYTAFLKYHFPKEYSAAVLNDTEFDKFDRVIKDAQRYGVKIETPDVNRSNSAFTPLEGNSISYGLSYIKRVASFGETIVAERANGLFHDFNDFMERTKCPKDTAEALVCAGALDNLVKGQSIVTKRNGMLAALERPTRFIDRPSCLISEKEFLGSFLNGNPVEDVKAKNTISKLALGMKNAELACIIMNVTKKQTKQGEDFAVIRVEDTTGSIYAAVYSKEYATYKDLLKENTIVILNGFCKEKQRRDEENEDAFQFVVRTVAQGRSTINSIILCPPDNTLTKRIMDVTNDYVDAQGIDLMLLTATGVAIPLKKKVSREILTDPEIGHMMITA